MEWFKTRDVGHATWAIDDNGRDIIYLIEGKNKSLLLDTGWGLGELPKMVSFLTGLPLIVVNSHGHPDHTLGNGGFQRVQIHVADEHFVNPPPSAAARKRFIDTAMLRLPPDFNIEAWAASVPSTLTTFQDNDTFVLGDRTLQVISVPGHTPGSVCLLDRAARFLFTGDSVLSGAIWLHLDESLALSEFHKNLQRLQKLENEFDFILPGHGALQDLPLPKGILNQLVIGIESILSGEVVGRDEKTFAGDGLRCDFGTCGIVYRPDRL